MQCFNVAAHLGVGGDVRVSDHDPRGCDHAGMRRAIERTPRLGAMKRPRATVEDRWAAPVAAASRVVSP
jgi:hypothetical protein